jgi:hypothetical protein
MNIENYRISNLSEEEIEKKIENEYCALIAEYTNKKGVFCVESHTPRIRGSFAYGKTVCFGHWCLPFSRMSEYKHWFLCSKKERKELMILIEENHRSNNI